jgi:hypothetical protein
MQKKSSVKVFFLAIERQLYYNARSNKKLELQPPSRGRGTAKRWKE